MNFDIPTGRRSLSERLVEQVKEQIRSGELAPGDRLQTERVLGASLGVSRTVVREAVARLQAEGLLEPRHGSGVFVTSAARNQAFQISRHELENMQDVAKLLELRLAVETEMAGLAAERRGAEDIQALRNCLREFETVSARGDDAIDADRNLHLAIAAATKNQYFLRFVEFIGPRLVPPRAITENDARTMDRKRFFETVNHEHNAIVDAIIEGDPEKARLAAREHLYRNLKHAQEVSLGRPSFKAKPAQSPN